MSDMLKEKQTQITLICDRCGRYGEKNTTGPFDNGCLHINRAGWHSHGADKNPDGRSLSYDLCRYCAGNFNQWMKTQEPVALAIQLN